MSIVSSSAISRASKASSLKPDSILEASFRNKNLTWETTDTLIMRLTSLTALDLSHNRLDNFPKALPSSITALNLSYNTFSDIFHCRQLSLLVELRLCGNHITDTKNLVFATKMKYLDLSHNLISVVKGLESMDSLITLRLGFNQIRSPIGVRSLAFNRTLGSLTLQGNPLAESDNYRVIIMNLIPSMVVLDDQVILQRKELYDSELHGYCGLFGDELNRRKLELANSSSLHRYQLPISSEASSPKRFARVIPGTTARSSNSETVSSTCRVSEEQSYQTTKETSFSSVGSPGMKRASTHIVEKAKNLHRGHSAHGSALDRSIARGHPSSFYFDASMEMLDSNINAQSTSAFPWRDPPNPIPRPWKGRHVVGSSGRAIASPSPSRKDVSSERTVDFAENSRMYASSRADRPSRSLSPSLTRSFGYGSSKLINDDQSDDWQASLKPSRTVQQYYSTSYSRGRAHERNSTSDNASLGRTSNSRATSAPSRRSSISSSVERSNESTPIPSNSNAKANLSNGDSASRRDIKLMPTSNSSATSPARRSLREFLKSEAGTVALPTKTKSKVDESALWMSPILRQRNTSTKSPQDREIDKIVDRIGLPEHHSTTSNYWSQRVAIDESKALQAKVTQNRRSKESKIPRRQPTTMTIKPVNSEKSIVSSSDTIESFDEYDHHSDYGQYDDKSMVSASVGGPMPNYYRSPGPLQGSIDDDDISEHIPTSLRGSRAASLPFSERMKVMQQSIRTASSYVRNKLSPVQGSEIDGINAAYDHQQFDAIPTRQYEDEPQQFNHLPMSSSSAAVLFENASIPDTIDPLDTGIYSALGIDHFKLREIETTKLLEALAELKEKKVRMLGLLQHQH